MIKLLGKIIGHGGSIATLTLITSLSAVFNDGTMPDWAKYVDIGIASGYALIPLSHSVNILRDRHLKWKEIKKLDIDSFYKYTMNDKVKNKITKKVDKIIMKNAVKTARKDAKKEAKKNG